MTRGDVILNLRLIRMPGNRYRFEIFLSAVNLLTRSNLILNLRLRLSSIPRIGRNRYRFEVFLIAVDVLLAALVISVL